MDAMTFDDLLLAVMAVGGAERGYILDRDLHVLAIAGYPPNELANLQNQDVDEAIKTQMLPEFTQPASLINRMGDQARLVRMIVRIPFAHNTLLLHCERSPQNGLLNGHHMKQMQALLSEAEPKLIK